MAAIELLNVSKTYPDGHVALTGLDLAVEEGELLVMVGPSGCGKSTALRIVAGLEVPTGGDVVINGQSVLDVHPRDRDVAMVFQNYALYPHMSVLQNLAFPLESRGMSRGEARDRARGVAASLGLAEHVNRKPRELSGGQRQRVAMGRAMVRSPMALLMDEPLSNLDARLRADMRSEICRTQRHLATATVYVTHDQIEAMTMGDRIAVLRKGELQQLGSAEQIYERPRNLFVASFVGSPTINLMEGTLSGGQGAYSLALGDTVFGLPRVVLNDVLPSGSERRVAVGVRPDRVRLESGSASEITISGTIAQVEMLGPERQVFTRVAARPVTHGQVLEAAVDIDATVASELVESGGDGDVEVVARVPSSLRPQPGERVTLAFDPVDVYLFDLDSGLLINEPFGGCRADAHCDE